MTVDRRRGSVFVYQWHFLNINNNIGFLFVLPSCPQYLLLVLFIEIFSQFSSRFQAQCERNEANRIVAINCDRNCYQLMTMKWNRTMRYGMEWNNACGLSCRRPFNTWRVVQVGVGIATINLSISFTWHTYVRVARRRDRESGGERETETERQHGGLLWKIGR